MHGNDKRNKNSYHLYGIFDRERNDLFKFGISGNELKEDGTSPRANGQVSLFNRLVGWVRFYAEILLTGIVGREKADKLENEYIQSYKEKHGKRPRGNPERNKD